MTRSYVVVYSGYMEITTIEAARRLGCSLEAVQRRCQKGMFPGAVKHGRDWSIPEEALAGLVIHTRKRVARLEARQPEEGTSE